MYQSIVIVTERLLLEVVHGHVVAAVDTAADVTLVVDEPVSAAGVTTPAFPAAASPITTNMHYCATARAVVVTPAALTGSSTTSVTSAAVSTAATTCPWTTSNSNRSVTITID
jgi:hypothetical protein